jgi:hypothetical protein
MAKLALVLIAGIFISGCSAGGPVGGEYYISFEAGNCSPQEAIPPVEYTPTQEYNTPEPEPTQTAPPGDQWCVSPDDPTVCLVVASGGLNIRNNPGGLKTGSVKDRTFVVVFDSRGDWRRIQKGWVHGDYLVCPLLCEQTPPDGQNSP